MTIRVTSFFDTITTGGCQPARGLDAHDGGRLGRLPPSDGARARRRLRRADPRLLRVAGRDPPRHQPRRRPCPHDHVLLANVVETLDDGGGWKAADTNLWRDELHAATVVGRLAAARVAGELGYGIEPDAGASGRLGHWRIAGTPDEVLALHSKRAAEITAAVAERGFD